MVGGCPTFAYAYPGGTLQRASIGDLTAAQLSARVERLLRPPARRKRAGDDQRRCRAPVRYGCRRRGRGWVAPPSPPSSRPGYGLGGGRAPARSQPRDGAGPLRDLSARFFGGRGPPCANGRFPGPIVSFSARSGSTPTAPRRRSSSSPGTGCATAPSEPRPARRRADDRHGRDRGGPARLRRRPVATAALHPRFRSRRVAVRGRPGKLTQGTLVVADEFEPVGLLFGDMAREPSRPAPSTSRIAGVAAIEVEGVPQIAIEEALWMAAATVERLAALNRTLLYRRREGDLHSERGKMPDLLSRDSFHGLRVDVDERAARRDLRRQIGRLGAAAGRPPRRGLRPGRGRFTASPRSRPRRGCSTSGSWSGCATSSPTASPTPA